MENSRLLKWFTCGLVVAASTSLASALSAQDDVLIPGGPIPYSVQPLLARQPGDNVFFTLVNDEKTGEESSKSEYWLGLQLALLPELAKQQLGVDNGLAVEEVMPDSPAAKAEIKKFDILVKADGTPLKEATDLIKAVDASQGKEMTIVIVRGGKDRTVRVVATKRPERERFDIKAPRPEVAVEIKRLEEALESLKNKAGKDGTGMWFFRPGVVAPRVEIHQKENTLYPRSLKDEFPKELSVQINKQGDQPTKIHVKRGDKEWDVTEDKLGDLPDDVRPHVQSLLGRMLAPGLAAAARHIVRVTPAGKVEGEMKIAPLPPKPPASPAAPRPPSGPNAAWGGVLAPPQASGSADSKLDAIIKKLDKVQKEIDELRGK